MTETEMRKYDDGRLLCVAKFSNGTHIALFNIFPYTGYRVNEEFYNEFKFRFCNLTENISNDPLIVEMYNSKRPEDI